MSGPPTSAEINRELFAAAVSEATGSVDARAVTDLAAYRALRSKALGAIAKLDSRLKSAAEMASIETRYNKE